MAFELAALSILTLALKSNNQVLAMAHGLTDATTAAVRIRAVIRDGGTVDGLYDPQGHRRGAAAGGRAHGSDHGRDHGRGQRGDEPLWATAALEGQLAMVRAALAGEGNDTHNDAAFALGQFAQGARA